MLESKRKMVLGVLLALIVTLLLPVAQPQQVYAQEEELGYLWSLDFTFDKDYNGLLTIEVGPWKNGELVGVNETSTAEVPCTPIGHVALDNGEAVFKGAGHLQCTMNLGQIVWENHGLKISDVDIYESIVVHAKVKTTSNTVAPIFTHPNATYAIDFTQNGAATLSQSLWNNAGVLQASYPNVSIVDWQDYYYEYICIAQGGPCDAYFGVSGQIQSTPTVGGRVRFSTGTTTFEIGRNGGTYFNGRLNSLIVDPGNSAH
jgi:hypothetical protein